MTGQVLVIDTDGTRRPVDWPAGLTDRGALEELYRLIGCTTVELVTLTPDVNMWIDEEGKYPENDPVLNAAANVLAHSYRAIQREDVIVGRAVLTSSDEDGYVAPLDSKILAVLVSTG